MITEEVTLSTGVTVTVAPVPQKVYDVIRMKHPDPPVPTVEGDLMGEKFRRENPDDADYRKRLQEVEDTRMMEIAEAQYIFGLPEIEVPDDWKPPAEELEYIAPAWKPREGRVGRKLDYIEWELLRVLADYQVVLNAINRLGMIPEEAVDAVEDTFPSDVEVETDGGAEEGSEGEAN